MWYFIILFIILVLAMKTQATEKVDSYNRDSFHQGIYDKYFSKVAMYSNKHNVNPYIILAMLTQESEGITTAFRKEVGYYDKYVNATMKEKLQSFGITRELFGSAGLMQVLYSTFLDTMKVSKKEDFYDVDKNIECGIMFFKTRMSRANGDELIAIQYYNTGSTLNKTYLDAVNFHYKKLWGKSL